MGDFLPILIIVATFFLMRFFKTKFRKLHFIAILTITIYFFYTAIVCEEKRYFNLLLTLLGAASVFTLFREIKNDQTKP